MHVPSETGVPASTYDPPPNAMHPVLAIYDEALPRIYGYFLARVGGRVSTAEDLTQETFVAAIRSNRMPEETGALIPWMFGIARHKLMDYYRQQERDRRIFGHPDPEPDDDADQPGLPDLDLESFPVRQAVLDTLDHLPPRQQAALVLKYVDGRDTAYTAAALGLSIDAAESLLRRARAAFRRRWAAHNGGLR